MPGLPCELSLCSGEGEVGRVLGGGYRVREFLSGLLMSVLVLSTLIVCGAEQTQCTAVFQEGLVPRNRQRTGVGLGAQFPTLDLHCVRMETYARFKGVEEASVTYS